MCLGNGLVRNLFITDEAYVINNLFSVVINNYYHCVHVFKAPVTFFFA